MAGHGTDPGARSTACAGPLLVVSPHLDDAALSCAALLERDEPVDVLTVFAGIPPEGLPGVWDLVCGFDTGAAAMRARRQEEATAFQGSLHRLVHLDLLDAQYVEPPRRGGDRGQLRRAVAAWLDERETGTVAVPAGAGARRTFTRRARRKVARTLGGRPREAPAASEAPEQHTDHTFVRDTALGILLEHDAFTPLLYEEIPYLWNAPADAEIERIARRTGRASVQVVLSVDRARKARRLAAYQSQSERLYAPGGRRLYEPEALPPTERYWRLERRR